MPISAFRRLSKTPKNRESFTGFYFLLGTALLFSALHWWDQTSKLGWGLETQFEFSLHHLKEFKFWTLFTHSLLHNNAFDLALSLIPLLFLIRALKRFYSSKEITRFFFFASFAESLSHALIAPSNQEISGSLGVTLAFLMLYIPLTGNTPLFYLRHFPITAPILSAFLMLFNLFTLGLPWRPDHSSFAGHLGILLFAWIYLRKSLTASLYSPYFHPQSSPPTFKKETEEWLAEGVPLSNPPPQSPTPQQPLSLEKQVDAILEKISQKGLDSLTDKERGILDKASKMKKQSRS